MRYILCLVFVACSPLLFADSPKKNDLAAKLIELADKPILPKEFDAPNMMSRDVRARLKDANQRDYDEWQKIKTHEDWEKFRDVRIAAMKKSLGDWPDPPKNMNVRVTRTIEGDGYKIENTLLESRPGLWVTANVYQPAKPGKSMPGILIVHSHHNPKHEGELQDMGVTWARAGCYVLIMDQLGHGERRIHPFENERSYPEPFRVGRQDYYFRYNLGMQLSLIGESLAGWMAWDLMRGIDLLLKKPDIDPEKIILLGAVAGGGDPAAVTAALDSRIKCVVPFNFGGPQPETKYPLADDAETTFNYVGGGSWESTRNLRDSARDGFLPWLIVASIAPRHLIYAHEFSWDRDRDPVWKRYEKIWGFYNAKDRIAFAHGKGTLSGRPPEASHCNNIGPVHREKIHEAFEKWFGIKAVEAKDRHTAEELRCLTPEIAAELKVRPISETIALWADTRFAKQNDLYHKTLKKDGKYHRDNWPSLSIQWANLAPTYSNDWSKTSLEPTRSEDLGNCRVDRMLLKFAGETQIPIVILVPKEKAAEPGYPIVFAVCQEGKSRFLKDRAAAVEKLLRNGIAVCVLDVRGTGESSPGASRGRGSGATGLSASINMLRGTLLGARETDLTLAMGRIAGWQRSTQKLSGFDVKRMAVWGESFAEVNSLNQRVAVPHDADKFPRQSEPLGGLLATMTALHSRSTELRAIVSRGSLLSYRSLLDSPFVHAPHDCIVPGALAQAAEIPVILAALGNCGLRIEGPVDGLNRRVSQDTLEKVYAPVRDSYGRDAAGLKKASLHAEYTDEIAVAKWLIEQLK